MFSLCKECFNEIDPEESLSYYREHYNQNQHEDASWDDVKDTVKENIEQENYHLI